MQRKLSRCLSGPREPCTVRHPRGVIRSSGANSRPGRDDTVAAVASPIGSHTEIWNHGNRSLYSLLGIREMLAWGVRGARWFPKPRSTESYSRKRVRGAWVNKRIRRLVGVGISSIPALIIVSTINKYQIAVRGEDCLRKAYFAMPVDRYGDFDSPTNKRFFAYLRQCKDRAGAVDLIGVWIVGTLVLYGGYCRINKWVKAKEKLQVQAIQSTVSVLLKADNGERILNDIEAWTRLSSPLFGFYDKKQQNFDDVIQVNKEILSRFKDKSYKELKDETREWHRKAGLGWPTASDQPEAWP